MRKYGQRSSRVVCPVANKTANLTTLLFGFMIEFGAGAASLFLFIFFFKYI